MIIFQALRGNSPALNTTTLWAPGRNLRKLIFSYNFLLLLTITVTKVIVTICLEMYRLMQTKQEVYSSGKSHFSLTAKEKLHFEVKSTYFMFTLTSSRHRNQNKHKILRISGCLILKRGKYDH